MTTLRIAVFMTMSEEDVARFDDLEATIKATLHELNTDDGDVVVPNVLGLDIDEDDVVDVTPGGQQTVEQQRAATQSDVEETS